MNERLFQERLGFQKTFVSSLSNDSGGAISFAPKRLPQTNRPCMLAVPIYADGLPYIHPQVPPVLVEWDGKLKEWVATGPAYDVGGNSDSASGSDHQPGPSGDAPMYSAGTSNSKSKQLYALPFVGKVARNKISAKLYFH